MSWASPAGLSLLDPATGALPNLRTLHFTSADDSIEMTREVCSALGKFTQVREMSVSIRQAWPFTLQVRVRSRRPLCIVP
jgi:hypothetical protein